MSKSFFFKMAAENIRKNRQTYLPFLLTCIGSCAMYNILGTLAVSKNVEGMYGGAFLQTLMEMGKWIVGIFSVIFLFYSNSFLLKRRKKEFGLYHVLGMEKRHIGWLLFLETFYTALICLVLGIGTSILLYKGIFLLLARLMGFQVTLGFEVSFSIMGETALLYGIIFLLIYGNGLRQIQTSEPIELLKGDQTGEREPKTRWLLVLVGVLSLGCGYYLAVTLTSPLEVFMMFFVAVILVMIGTYCLFMAGSIFALKVLKRNKGYYYKPRHFTAISGMIYRMKQNAAGLASICIMSTAVLLIMSTTTSLYFSVEDLVRIRYPRDMMIYARSNQGDQEEHLKNLRDTVQDILKSHGLSMEKEESYSYMTVTVCKEEDELRFADWGYYVDAGKCYATICFLSLEDYNRASGENLTLDPDEMYIQRVNGEEWKDALVIGEKTWKIKGEVSGLDSAQKDVSLMENIYYLILPGKEGVEEIRSAANKALGVWEQEDYYLSFDLAEKKEIIGQEITQAVFINGNYGGYLENRDEEKEAFHALYGGLFFLGLFLGFMFLMATVLVIYYKQVSEGYEDHQRFVIMQKVGMSKAEVRKTINTQIRIVFLLPVLVAGLHIAFAYPMMTRLLCLLNMVNQELFFYATVITYLVYLLFYAMVYKLTARTYYRLVRW